MVFCIRHLMGISWQQKMPTVQQALILVAVLLVFHNEYLCFIISRLKWASVPTSLQGESSELRMLLVADPQLVGLRYEHLIFGPITRWDCDSFLRSGFRQAFNYIQPDVVVFLGDLLDEGSIATDDDYITYVNRFQSVFYTPSNVQRIFIPGDNDVGGEGMERKEKWKVNRFTKAFYNSEENFIHVKFVDFFKLSYDFGEEFASSMKATLINQTQLSKAPFRIILNHMGVFVRHPAQYNQLVEVAKPSLFITAHSHMAAIYQCIECADILSAHVPNSSPRSDHEVEKRWKESITTISDSTVYDFELDSSKGILELVVPTCSYRMGVPEFGYGVAVLGADGHLRYTVLWLPSRYLLLYSYVAFLVASLGLFSLKKLITLFKRKHYRKWTKLRNCCK